MNASALIERWQALAPREQWLCLAVALLLPAMLWLVLVHDPLAQRHERLRSQQQADHARLLDANVARAELAARAAADPDRAVREALQAAEAVRERHLNVLQRETAALIDPQRMQKVLQDLLQSRPGLRLQGLESFSEPLRLPAAPAPAGAVADSAAPAVEPAPILYRHGMRLSLEGSYFELRDYLRSIEGGDWRLFWERLDYRVEETGPGRARITVELYTLSREAGWIGV